MHFLARKIKQYFGIFGTKIQFCDIYNFFVCFLKIFARFARDFLSYKNLFFEFSRLKCHLLQIVIYIFSAKNSKIYFFHLGTKNSNRKIQNEKKNFFFDNLSSLRSRFLCYLVAIAHGNPTVLAIAEYPLGSP